MAPYGPLIDLSTASSHVGEFVQLLVFVHRSSPRQFNKSGRVVRTDVDVGDETRPFFCISLWNHHLASAVSAGDICFFRNVKVIQFRSMIEANSVGYTSILRLVHPYSALLSRGVEDLVATCPLVGSAMDKLRRLINWVHLTKSSPSNRQLPASRNWKVPDELKPFECPSLSQVLQLSSPCKTFFRASIAHVYLHSNNSKEILFFNPRLPTNTHIILEHIICTGCQLCGIPSSFADAGKDDPLHCHKNSNRFHTLGLIYRPFMLQVWDNSAYIPLLVKNKAAEVLFGNISAEEVYQSYKCQKDNLKNPLKEHDAQDYRTSKGKGIVSSSAIIGLESSGISHGVKGLNFYRIWLILFKMLLLQGQDSSLKFEALVDPCLALEDGRFDMISVSMLHSYSHNFPASSTTA